MLGLQIRTPTGGSLDRRADRAHLAPLLRGEVAAKPRRGAAAGEGQPTPLNRPTIATQHPCGRAKQNRPGNCRGGFVFTSRSAHPPGIGATGATPPGKPALPEPLLRARRPTTARNRTRNRRPTATRRHPATGGHTHTRRDTHTRRYADTRHARSDGHSADRSRARGRPRRGYRCRGPCRCGTAGTCRPTTRGSDPSAARGRRVRSDVFNFTPLAAVASVTSYTSSPALCHEPTNNFLLVGSYST